MTFPSNLVPSLRLRAIGGRLVCLLSLPSGNAPHRGFSRQLALVASPRPPHLRRLTVYRRDAEPALRPGGAGRAA